MKRRGPDSLEGWIIALLTCLISTLMYGSAGLSSMLFVASITRYNADRNQASFPYILSYVLQAVTGPFAGYFAKKFGVRAVVMIGSILGFIGIATCFFAESITVVTILWGIVYGTGLGFSTLLLPAIVNDYFFKYRSIALGMCFLGSAIGFFIFPPVFELLYNKYGLSGTFLIQSAIVMHCIPLSIFLKQPNFSIEDTEKATLSSDAKNKLYSSITSISHSIKHESKCDKIKSETDHATNTHFRRYSLDFLWQQPSLHTSSLENMKESVLISKEKYSPGSQNDMHTRSYENINKNSYECLNNLLCRNSCTAHRKQTGNGLLKPDKNYFYSMDRNLEYKNSKIYRKDEESISSECILVKELNLVPHSAKETTDTDNNIKEIEDIMLKFPRTQKHYREFSTIYFGIDNPSYKSSRQELNLESQPVSSFLDDTKYFKGHTYQSCNQPSENISTNNYALKASSTNFTHDSLKEFPKLENASDSRVSLHKKQKKQHTVRNTAKLQCESSVLRMYIDPIFIIICIVNGIFNLQYSAMTTIIIDFARDLQIDSTYDKYVMMCISLTGVFGMLGFGWVTDGGYMTRSKFSSLCLLVGSISIAVLPKTVGLITFIIVLSIFCISQASFVPLIPAVIAEYFEADIQAVAVSACNVLCGPMYFVIPPLIGYFRDGRGSYDYIFYLLSILTLFNSVSMFSIPFIARWRSKKTSYDNC